MRRWYSDGVKVEKRQFISLCIVVIAMLGAIAYVEFTDEIATSLLPKNPEVLKDHILTKKSPADLGELSTAEIHKYIDVLGFSETIEILNQIDPAACHDAAHIIGDLAFDEAGSVAESFNLCTEKCMSGCIHGALLAAVKGEIDYDAGKHEHVNLDDFSTDLQDICTVETSDPTLEGTCIHGVGHALMSLSVSIDTGLGLCVGYEDERKQYYCESGVFMEALLGEFNNFTSSTNPLYPCDTYGTHPAACMRYQTNLIELQYEPDIIAYCNSLEDNALHIGCYHGLGRSKTMDIYQGEASILLCLESDVFEARASCVEGIGEVLHEYDYDTGAEICNNLENEPDLLAICRQALTDGLYSLEKDFTPYIGEAATRQ